MPTAKLIQPDFTTMGPTEYKAAIDATISAMLRPATPFAPYAQDTPNMTVRLEAGHIPPNLEVAAQSTGTITAPSVHPRIDLVAIDNATGAVSVVTGVEAASPAAPALPDGKSLVALVALTTLTTAITNANLTDMRNLGLLGLPTFGTAAGFDVGTDPTQIPRNQDILSGAPTGYITGLALAFASTTTLTVSPGKARDGADAADIALASAITKSLSAWAVGSGNGGLDTGSVAANTYYYVWLITRTDGTVVDVLLSLSGTAPTMPTGYTIKRVIGRIRTNGSSQINPLIIISANPGIGGREIWKTTESTGAYVQPPWTPDYDVAVQGGGGGGAGSSDDGRGSGGGAGGYGSKRVRGQAAGTSTTVTVGANGSGGAACGPGNSGNSGTSGQTSSFGSMVTAAGGVGGATANGAPGAGGSASGGDENITGQSGCACLVGSAILPGSGGNSVMGLGGAVSAGTGTDATGFGAGGAGAAGATGNAGSNGSPGLVKITM